MRALSRRHVPRPRRPRHMQGVQRRLRAAGEGRRHVRPVSRRFVPVLHCDTRVQMKAEIDKAEKKSRSCV